MKRMLAFSSKQGRNVPATVESAATGQGQKAAKATAAPQQEDEPSSAELSTMEKKSRIAMLPDDCWNELMTIFAKLRDPTSDIPLKKPEIRGQKDAMSILKYNVLVALVTRLAGWGPKEWLGVLQNIHGGEEGFRADEIKEGFVNSLVNLALGRYWYKRALRGVDPLTKFPDATDPGCLPPSDEDAELYSDVKQETFVEWGKSLRLGSRIFGKTMQKKSTAWMHVYEEMQRHIKLRRALKQSASEVAGWQYAGIGDTEGPCLYTILQLDSLADLPEDNPLKEALDKLARQGAFEPLVSLHIVDAPHGLGDADWDKEPWSQDDFAAVIKNGLKISHEQTAFVFFPGKEDALLECMMAVREAGLNSKLLVWDKGVNWPVGGGERMNYSTEIIVLAWAKGSSKANWIWSACPEELRDNKLFCPALNVTFKTSAGKCNAHQKPVQLMHELLRRFAPRQGVVADWTAGSGTTAAACALYETRQAVILIDKDDTQVDVCRQRMKGSSLLQENKDH